MAYREISVEQLRYGMYVAQLDRPWTDTPFMFQGFVLRNEKQLGTLKKFCQRVFVDPEREDRSEDPTGAAKQVRGTTVYKEQASVEVELPRARTAFAQSTVVVTEITRTVSLGKAVDGHRAKEAASQITESVVRNPDAITLLARMREKGGETLNRAVEVSVTMTIFGRFLQFTQEQLEMLGLLGLLQDVGKLNLPAALLAKKTALTEEEQELYKTHVNHSVEILSKTTGLPPEFPALASLHHERHDGSGYPRGLKGNAISHIGAIAAIVDAYDTMIAPKPFGEQMTPSNALSVLYRSRGTQFHPALVEQFMQCIGVFPVGAVVEMNSGEVGIVIAQNPVRRLQPRVMIVQDAAGNAVRPYKMLDLMKEPKATADEPYRIRRTLEADKVRVDPRELFL